MPSAAIAIPRVSRPFVFKAQERNPAYAIYRLRPEEPSSGSSGDTTPSTRRSIESSTKDDDSNTAKPSLILNVPVHAAVGPSRFGFEFMRYDSPPASIAYSTHPQLVQRILATGDTEVRRTSRALCKGIKAALDASLAIKPSRILYGTHPGIVHRILDFADHETRITCRRLCRQIKDRVDREIAPSIFLTTIAVDDRLCLHITASQKRRIPGLPPQSYDAWDAWAPRRAYTNPKILQHTRTLTYCSNFGNICIGRQPVSSRNIVGVLIPHLRVHTVRDAYAGSLWRSPIPCTKYVTLTLLTPGRLVGVPPTPDGTRDRILNITAPRDSRPSYRSLLDSLRLSASVRRVVLILHFPPVVRPANFHDLALTLGAPAGVLSRVAEQIAAARNVHFTIVGADTAPPTVLGFDAREPLPRAQLHYELYQRLLPHYHTFAQYRRLRERVTFMSLAEYRAHVGERCFEEDFVYSPW